MGSQTSPFVFYHKNPTSSSLPKPDTNASFSFRWLEQPEINCFCLNPNFVNYRPLLFIHTSASLHWHWIIESWLCLGRSTIPWFNSLFKAQNSPTFKRAEELVHFKKHNAIHNFLKIGNDINKKYRLKIKNW